MQVSNSNVFRVGQWVRLWNSDPGNRSRPRRSLLELQHPDQPLATQPGAGSATGRRLRGAGAPPPLRLFRDAYLQAAVAAAAAAEMAAAEAAAAAGLEPDKADALAAADPVAAQLAAEREAEALNPLQLDAMLLAAARYGSLAMAAEIAAGDFDPAWLDEFAGDEGTGAGAGNASSNDGRAPALAVEGSLDFYLYGDNCAVDSGTDYSERWGGGPAR